MKDIERTPENFAKMMFEPFLQDNDRSAAITSAALLEHWLQLAIVSKWPKMSNRTRDELFGDQAPLGNFGAKIKLGYAMGLYEPDVRADLDRVRRIRNLYAHTMMPLDFKAENVSKVCATLQTVPPVNPILEPRLEEDGGFSAARWHFLVATYYLAGTLARIVTNDPRKTWQEMAAEAEARLKPSPEKSE
jgi:hypothetical protein